MILYHGSNVIVKNPIIIKTDIGRDFGFAFYLTPIKEQAEKMAKRTMRRKRDTKALVSVFEWDENKSDLKYKSFIEADMDWLGLVVNCRSKKDYIHGFDIVEGKIADDTVGETISFIIDGVIDMETGLKKLKYQKINSQIAFCSDKSLNHIKYIDSYEVK